MAYRTRTYIAADWENDKSVVDKLRQLNESDYFRLDFVDAHEFKQAKDTSLYCSIKKSLSERMERSKNFILIVSQTTDSRRSGSCQYCYHYLPATGKCLGGGHADLRSYIQYECEKAIRDKMKIIVIYKASKIVAKWCPEILKNIGTHVTAYKLGEDGKLHWNVKEMTDAINN